MELTKEQLITVQELSKEIEFGRVTVSFSGAKADIVDIVAEKHIKFHNGIAKPTTASLKDRQKLGRMGTMRQG